MSAQEESYQDRIDREYREKNAHFYSKLPGIVEALNRLTGKAWTLTDNSERYCPHVKLTSDQSSPDAPEIICIHRNQLKRDEYRLGINGDYGKLREFVRHGDGDSMPSITVNPGRSYEAIAREIIRRVLPNYSALILKLQERAKARNDGVAERDAVVRELVEASNGHIQLPSRDQHYQERGEDVHLHWWHSVTHRSLDIRVSQSGVYEMTLRYVPVNTAAQIVSIAINETKQLTKECAPKLRLFYVDGDSKPYLLLDEGQDFARLYQEWIAIDDSEQGDQHPDWDFVDKWLEKRGVTVFRDITTDYPF